jgi:hypothetical protein
MRRRFYGWIAGVSFVMALIFSAAWLRAQFARDLFERSGTPPLSVQRGIDYVGIEDSALVVMWEWPRNFIAITPWSLHSHPIAPVMQHFNPGLLGGLGFAANHYVVSPTQAGWIVAAPLWLLCGISLIAPACWVRDWRRNTIRLHRQAWGLCTACGYDLRQTIGRCPECGTPPALPNNPLP